MDKKLIMRDEKTRLVRKEPMDGGNSIFHLDALFVTKVWEADPFISVKYDYNVLTKTLTIFGDIEAIYVHYKR